MRVRNFGRTNDHYWSGLKNAIAMFGPFPTLKGGLALLFSWMSRKLEPYDDFDRANGVDTVAVGVADDVKKWKMDPIHRKSQYHPTPERAVRYLLGNLGVTHENFCFVDFGSGKGRVVMIAAEYPFRSIQGVEISNAMTEIAKRNLIAYRKRHSLLCSDIEFYVGDARRFQPPESDTVFFLYNPFGQLDPTVLRDVLSKIDASLRVNSRNVILIYLDMDHPRYDVREILGEFEGFRQIQEYPNLFSGLRWLIARTVAWQDRCDEEHRLRSTRC